MTQAGLTPSLRLILEDASLSAKAKGIAALLEYLRTSGRTVRNGRELSELVRDGRDAVYKAIRELRIKGYVEGRGPKIKIINNVRSGNPGKPQSGFSGFCQTNNPDFQDLGVPAIRIFRILPDQQSGFSGFRGSGNPDFQDCETPPPNFAPYYFSLSDTPETKEYAGTKEHAGIKKVSLGEEKGHRKRGDCKGGETSGEGKTLSLGVQSGNSGLSFQAKPGKQIRYPEEFDALWKVSRRGSKKKAYEYYRRLKNLLPPVQELIETWKKQDRCRAARRRAGLFAPEPPHLFRWLRDRRFEDELHWPEGEEPEEDVLEDMSDEEADEMQLSAGIPLPPDRVEWYLERGENMRDLYARHGKEPPEEVLRLEREREERQGSAAGGTSSGGSKGDG